MRLRRPLPEHSLAAGSKGTVVNAFQVRGQPTAYLVEFPDSGDRPLVIIHVAQEDLEVIWRPQ
ncbi:DUF4926 domain-containing protein [Mycobacterium ahvazicum]|uniref:DUF4926 domain-containing protein n=1 Tax=Mycobacterium ahvazicum TaxID=1964395 RepID=UPI0013FDA8CF|nr:DUF4926 domain-containing protein [Mycobacterium ahvazicum]